MNIELSSTWFTSWSLRAASSWVNCHCGYRRNRALGLEVFRLKSPLNSSVLNVWRAHAEPRRTLARLSLDLGAYADRLREIESHGFSCEIMKSVLYVSQSLGSGRSGDKETRENRCDIFNTMRHGNGYFCLHSP